MAKEPWSGVSGLGQGGHGATFYKAKSAGQHGAIDLGVLVKSGGQAHGIGQIQPGNLRRQDRIVRLCGYRAKAHLQRTKGDAVRIFGIKQMQRLGRQAIDPGHERLPS